jgi:hypothetical protein
MYQYINSGCQPPQSFKGPARTNMTEDYGYGYLKAGVGKKAYWHPGYAWAYRRETMNKLPLIDKAILGAGDHHMAMCLVGKPELSLPKGLHQGYNDEITKWARLADIHVRRNVGYVPGTLSHHWHGPKQLRRYGERWDVLRKTQFNPYTDLNRDAQGMYRLNDFMDLRSIQLRDQIREYFRARNEDSIDRPQ